jgi:hypothetical protein
MEFDVAAWRAAIALSHSFFRAGFTSPVRNCLRL